MAQELDKSISSNRVFQFGSANGDKPVSVSCIRKDEQSDVDSPLPVSTPAVTGDTPVSSRKHMLATNSPASQVMERSADEPNRIPSSVFDRSNSNSPMDWSVASNDSLFSIHVGDSSFTKDHVLWPSGELSTPGGASMSSRMCNFSVHNSPFCTSDEGRSGELRPGAEAEEFKRVSEDQNEKSIAEGRTSRTSVESSHSTKSFAFPVLAGGGDHVPSARISGSVRIDSDRQRQQPQLVPEPQPQPQQQPQPQPEPKSAEPAQHACSSSTKWFPCFSCCPYCSS